MASSGNASLFPKLRVEAEGNGCHLVPYLRTSCGTFTFTVRRSLAAASTEIVTKRIGQLTSIIRLRPTLDTGSGTPIGRRVGRENINAFAGSSERMVAHGSSFGA